MTNISKYKFQDWMPADLTAGAPQCTDLTAGMLLGGGQDWSANLSTLSAVTKYIIIQRG